MSDLYDVMFGDKEDSNKAFFYTDSEGRVRFAGGPGAGGGGGGGGGSQSAVAARDAATNGDKLYSFSMSDLHNARESAQNDIDSLANLGVIGGPYGGGTPDQRKVLMGASTAVRNIDVETRRRSEEYNFRRREWQRTHPSYQEFPGILDKPAGYY